MSSGANPSRRADVGKSKLSLILDNYNFKPYINTIGREELLAGTVSSEDVAKNLEIGRISDTLFSLSNNPMFTKDFIASKEPGFGGVKNIGKNLQVTFENVNSLTINSLTDNKIIIPSGDEQPNIQILNLKHNSFRNTLRSPIVNKESKVAAISCRPQGFVEDESANLDVSNEPFSIKGMLLNEEVNVNPNQNPTKSSPHLATYQIFDESLAIGNRQTSELAVFLNMIPTIELSRCVPIISAKFSLPDRIYKGPPTSTKEFAVASNADFLFGSEPKSAKRSMDAFRGDTFIKKMRNEGCLLYTSPSPRDLSTSRMPSSA